MASIRLTRWFAPRTVASIQQREAGYFIVATGKNNQIRGNNALVFAGRKERKAGDVIEVAGHLPCLDPFHVCLAAIHPSAGNFFVSDRRDFPQ